MNIGGLYRHKDSRVIYTYFEENEKVWKIKKLGRIKNNEPFVLLAAVQNSSEYYLHLKILSIHGIVGWIRYAGMHLLCEVKP